MMVISIKKNNNIIIIISIFIENRNNNNETTLKNSKMEKRGWDGLKCYDVANTRYKILNTKLAMF